MHLKADDSRLAGHRILVVEDNAVNQLVARALLESEGATVEMAENGLVAVTRLESDPTAFDVVLMDIQMPELDGHQATRQIRARLEMAELLIIAMTADVAGSDRDACLASGMNDHIGKPFRVDDAVTCIQRHLPKPCAASNH